VRNNISLVDRSKLLGNKELIDGVKQMEEVKRYRLLCDQMFAADSRVRYAVVLDEECSIVAGGMRPGVTSIESREESRRVDLQVVVLLGVIKTWSEVFGPASFVLFKHEKVNIIIFPIGNRQLDISTEPDFSFEDIRKLLRILERWKQAE